MKDAKTILKEIKALMKQSGLDYTTTCNKNLKSFVKQYLSDDKQEYDFYYRSKGKGNQPVLVIVSTKNKDVHQFGVATYKSIFNGDSKRGHLPSCLEMTNDKFVNINLDN